MAKLKRKASRILFNIEVYENQGSKEYTVKAMPINFLNDVVKQINEKYR